MSASYAETQVPNNLERPFFPMGMHEVKTRLRADAEAGPLASEEADRPGTEELRDELMGLRTRV